MEVTDKSTTFTHQLPLCPPQCRRPYKLTSLKESENVLMDDKALLDQVVMLYWSVDSSSSLKYVPKENNKTMRELSDIYIYTHTHSFLLEKAALEWTGRGTIKQSFPLSQ